MITPATRPPRLSTLVLLTALSVLTLNMFLPSLANIARDLGTSYAMASLAVSGYLAVNGVMQLIVGPLADRYGRRPILLGCLCIFILASFVCAVAQDITVFLIARTIQAVIIAGATIASAVISDTSKPEEAASRMAYVGMAMAVAPMLAPMMGGFLDEAFGWRSGFWVYTGLGTFALWLTWVDLGETNPAPANTLFDQVKSYPELFRSRRFWGYSMVMAFGVGVFFFFVAAAPLVAQDVFGLTPAMVGIGIGSITGGFFLGSFLSGRYSRRMGLLWMILAGRIVALTGLVAALIVLMAGVSHPYVFFGGAILAGFGNGLSVPNARAGALAIRPHLAGSASGLSGALTVVVGAGLTTLPGLILTAQNGAWLTLVVMIAVAALALLSALYAGWIDRREGAAA